MLSIKGNFNFGGGSLFPNGTEWNLSNNVWGDFNSIYYADNLFVGATNTGLCYSNDGITWTQSNIISGDFRYVYNANGIWVAGSYNSSNGLYYSNDGITWTQSNITNGTFYSVYNANGIWIAGSGSNGLYYSVTWELSILH